jgi:hypothetical protein
MGLLKKLAVLFFVFGLIVASTVGCVDHSRDKTYPGYDGGGADQTDGGDTAGAADGGASEIGGDAADTDITAAGDGSNVD